MMIIGVICWLASWCWFLAAVVSAISGNDASALSAIAIAAFLHWVASDIVGGAE